MDQKSLEILAPRSGMEMLRQDLAGRIASTKCNAAGRFHHRLVAMRARYQQGSSTESLR
jgi:hypothetical protein